MDNFIKWQKREQSNKQRMAAMAVGALIFPTLIPLCLIAVLPQVDQSLGLGSFFHGWGNYLVGITAIVIGAAAAVWTFVVQINLASGTPFPMLPTQKLLIVGPFKYCRNPMTLGTILLYGGIAVLIGSYASLLAVIILAGILIAYLKLIEEKELQLRFGSDYLEYKKTTPFIFPIKFRGGSE